MGGLCNVNILNTPRRIPSSPCSAFTVVLPQALQHLSAEPGPGGIAAAHAEQHVARPGSLDSEDHAAMHRLHAHPQQEGRQPDVGAVQGQPGRVDSAAEVSSTGGGDTWIATCMSKMVG